jgi:hypothetical protein
MRSEQGDVYEKIIQEVVDASKNDFEESGVGQGTLNELQQVSDDTFIIHLSFCFCQAPSSHCCAPDERRID